MSTAERHRRAILRAWIADHSPATVVEVAAGTRLRQTAVATSLPRMARAGEVERRMRGRSGAYGV